jgi:hypothetical protein
MRTCTSYRNCLRLTRCSVVVDTNHQSRTNQTNSISKELLIDDKDAEDYVYKTRFLAATPAY